MNTPPPRNRVNTLRRRYRSNVLNVDALTGYGFSGRCDCGWYGRRRPTWAEARAELRAHIAEAHP